MALRLWVYIALLYQHLLKQKQLTPSRLLPPVLEQAESLEELEALLDELEALLDPAITRSRKKTSPCW